MPLTLYVATTNAGKLRDFEQAEQSCSSSIRFLPLPGLEKIPAPPEDAPTFEENAISKAIAYSHYAPNELVLADDSGLEVDALGGAPGVRSARFAADARFNPQSLRSLSTDECNNLFLMKRLINTSQAHHIARYRCVLATALDGKCIQLAQGVVEGIILVAPRGCGGFGYDPLFFLPELGQTMAEISQEKRLQLSHRGRALRALLRQLCA